MILVVMLCSVLVVAGAIVFWSRSARAGRVSLMVLMLLAAATLWMHGWRPALLPTYLAAVMLIVAGTRLRRYFDTRQPTRTLIGQPAGESNGKVAGPMSGQPGVGLVRRVIGGMIRLVCCLACVACALLTALTWVGEPPALTGPYTVGTFDWLLTDRGRMEVYTQDPSDTRQILVRVWYPSEALADDPALRATWVESIAGQRREYISSAVAQGFMGEMLPAPVATLLVSGMHRLTSPGASGIPLAPGTGRFPVLLFTPGYGMPIDLSAAHLAEIASHGYVVLGVNISYETAVTQLPDGRILRPRDLVRQDETKGNFALEQSLGATAAALLPEMIQLMDLPEPQRKARYLELRRQRMPGEQFLVAAIDQRVLDLQHVLTELEQVADGTVRNLLTGRVALDRVGVFGMSLGGPAAGQFCLIDLRCKAGLNYDGEIWGEQLTRMDARVPFMWLRGPADSKQGEAYSLGIPYLFEASSAPAYYVEIAGMEHMYFTDLVFLLPVFNWLSVPLSRMLSEPDLVLRGRQTALDYTVAFFDRYLKQLDPPLLHAAGRAEASGARVAVKFKQRNVAASAESSSPVP